jgi:hypothetical protein
VALARRVSKVLQLVASVTVWTTKLLVIAKRTLYGVEQAMTSSGAARVTTTLMVTMAMTGYLVEKVTILYLESGVLTSCRVEMAMTSLLVMEILLVKLIP